MGNDCPYDKASWLSKATFWWINPLFRAGRKFSLTKEDVYDVMPTDEASLLSDRLQRFWEAEIEYSQRKRKEPNLFKTVLLAFKNDCLYFGIFLLLTESMRLIQPFLIGQLIGYFQPGSPLTPAEVYLLAAALGISGLCRLLFDPSYYFKAHYLAMRMKTAVGSLIYRKVLKISSLSLHKTNSGQIINYLSTDLEKFNMVCTSRSQHFGHHFKTSSVIISAKNFTELCSHIPEATETFHFIWITPLEVVIIITLVYSNLGPACLFMIPVLLCVVPIQSLLGRLFGKLRIKIAAWTDKRIHRMNEIIAGMKVIKMYCWEKPFGHLITNLRNSEIRYLWYAAVAKAWNDSLFLTGSRLVSLTVFVSAWQMNVPLTSTIVFSTMGWIECLKTVVFRFLFSFVECNVQLSASLKRIKDFLILDEMADMTKQDKNSRILYTGDSKAEYSINIDQMTAVWTAMAGSESTKDPDNMGEELTEGFSLKDINLKVKRVHYAKIVDMVAGMVYEPRGLYVRSTANVIYGREKGELIAVVGAVGSGKSSLLMTLLGELPAVDGKITVSGTLGYVSQQPWVVTGTLRDNVLFGEVYVETKYNRVINACALDKDIEQMKHGDQTLVGERGLLLSGGQKARLTLARCLYKDVDIYILDDPLGAVDTEVGRHLFSKCICGYLENKTRILVTHQLQYLRTVDEVILLKEGSVVSVGSYEELMANREELSEILSDMHSEKEKKMGCITDNPNTKTVITEREELEDEDMESGVVGWRVYKDYITAAYPKLTVPLLLVLIISLQLSFIFGDWHLAKWAEYQDNVETGTLLRNTMMDSNISSVKIDCVGGVTCQSSNQHSYAFSATVTSVSNVTSSLSLLISHEEYVYVYGVSVCMFVVFAIIMSGVFYTTLTTAGKRLHDKMFSVVIGAKTAFFDSNPIGRILNRFSRDVGIMDELVPRLSFTVFEMTIRLTAILITTCVINPLLLIPLCPLVVYIIFVRNYAVQTTRHLKRIESVTKSPVYSHVSDTLHGLQSIRALNLSKDFIQQFDSCQNQHTSSAFVFLASLRWLGVRSLFGIYSYLIFVIMLSLILKDVIGLTGGLYGLSLNYVIILADPFDFLMRQSAELETYMTSVERITAYSKLEKEADKVSSNPPPPSWPIYGEIVCKELSLRYSPESPTVLKNINFIIKAQEKIGIVGRTGAGKSSLLASFLRLAEPTGCLLIDGVNVLNIGLHELRAKISVIPQDPTLFSGTLRYNLDPFAEYQDEILWKSLQQVQLKTKVEGMPGQLYTEVSEGGKNFSVGQRQLVCLARAILNYNKILVLDEATANVDHRTDELIQTTIREQFRECTVLTVAHRLHTIMDSDRVMAVPMPETGTEFIIRFSHQVLDQGELKEFDIPYKLLQTDGYFRHLVDQTGKAQVQQLHALALHAYQQRAALSTTSTTE